MYLTYDDYIDMGGNLSENSFRSYIFQAEKAIDYRTFDRLTKEPFNEYPERTQFAVKQCIFSLIKLLQAKDDTLGIGVPDSDTNITNVSAETNDGVSRTYNVIDANYVEATYKNRIDSTINQSLQGCLDCLGRKLLYRGIYPDE